MTCCLRSLIAIKLDSNGTFIINMSLLKTIAPGDLSIVRLMEHRIACMHDANALFNLIIVDIILIHRLMGSHAVVLIEYTMPFDTGFFTVVGFNSTPICTSRL